MTCFYKEAFWEMVEEVIKVGENGNPNVNVCNPDCKYYYPTAEDSDQHCSLFGMRLFQDNGSVMRCQNCKSFFPNKPPVGFELKLSFVPYKRGNIRIVGFENES